MLVEDTTKQLPTLLELISFIPSLQKAASKAN